MTQFVKVSHVQSIICSVTEIGQDLAKLEPKTEWNFFMGHSVGSEANAHVCRPNLIIIWYTPGIVYNVSH